MMNDEFVSHNNSSGGWDMLNKWVSMLKKRGCMADPWKQRGLVLCLLYFRWVEICGISSIFTTEIGFLEGINALIPGIMILCASGNACVSIKCHEKCGKVRKAFFPGMLGSCGECAPADLQLCYHTPAPACRRSFHSCLFRALHSHLCLGGTPHSQCPMLE